MNEPNEAMIEPNENITSVDRQERSKEEEEYEDVPTDEDVKGVVSSTSSHSLDSAHGMMEQNSAPEPPVQHTPQVPSRGSDRSDVLKKDPSVVKKNRMGEEMSLTRSQSRRIPMGSDGHSKFKQAKSDESDHISTFSSKFIILPWSLSYKVWWSITVCAALLTIFTETYDIAFAPAGLAPYNDASSIIEVTLTAIFAMDIVVNFVLAYSNQSHEIVHEHKKIAWHYLSKMFWVDLVGVFPFTAVALAATGQMGQDSLLAQYLSLLRLLRFVRLHRLVLLFKLLQYSTKISLFSLTLIRNYFFSIVWCHFNACAFYFIARLQNFDPDNTWLGDNSSMSIFEQYVTALYFAVVTFTTLGYGDISAKNSAEQIWDIIYIFINIVFTSWVIGSITLLVVKADQKTSLYRESLAVLDKFSRMHDLDETLTRQLKAQLKLEFSNKELEEELVLSQVPSALRGKVLRKIYFYDLLNTNLFFGIRQQFLLAFLAACKAEIISAGEDLLHQGAVASDLYFLVSGSVKLVTDEKPDNEIPNPTGDEMDSVDSEGIPEGKFINEIDFFTSAPQRHTIRTSTVCKTLRLDRSDYKILAYDYPDCVNILLKNLLEKVRGTFLAEEIYCYVSSVPQDSSSLSVEDSIQAFITTRHDEQTTHFLFAASRGDTERITKMCEHGFDPNAADYDRRTALMVASMNGHVPAISKLMEYLADPNLVDVHGSSALYEAARNGHDFAVQELLRHGARLCMPEYVAAARLCQAVSDGNLTLLRCLLQAKIDVNASDYDNRTAAHIAAAEGNLSALKLLAEAGAAVLEVRDRWNNTVEDEAKKSRTAQQMLEYLQSLKKE